MTYSVAYDEADGIVCLTVSEPAVRGDHYAAWDVALRLCEEKACSRVLVDFGGLRSSTFTTMDTFNLSEIVGRTPRYIRIAHVVPEHRKVRENVCFAGTIQANRGKDVRDFDTVEQAHNWLLAKP